MASCLPNIYNLEQLVEFCEATDKKPISQEELSRIAELYASNFGVEGEEGKYKGTMERETVGS